MDSNARWNVARVPPLASRISATSGRSAFAVSDSPADETIDRSSGKRAGGGDKGQAVARDR